MKNIGSITYNPALNKLYLPSKKVIRFYERFDPQRIQTFISLVLTGITPIEDLEEDVHLEAFLAPQDRLSKLQEEYPANIGIIVYPVKGEIKHFHLNKEEFFSDNHNNPDPMTIIKMKYGLHIHPTRTDDYLWLNYESNAVPNRITGGIFFKRNPVANPELYDGFQELLNSNEFKPWLNSK